MTSFLTVLQASVPGDTGDSDRPLIASIVDEPSNVNSSVAVC
ncbi:MAG: hypothetical protein AAGD07_09950 [Planctomycetota bacterium]